MRTVGFLCIGGVVVGPAIWIADLLGFRLQWFPVRNAFLVMLAAFTMANVVALVHVGWFSRTPKSQRWNSVHRLFSPLQMFAAFEYLIDSDRRRRAGAPGNTPGR